MRPSWFDRLFTSKSRRGPGRARLRLEALEHRWVPSTLTWANEGSPTNDRDRFNAVFGSSAGEARQVVETALKEWGDVIVNLNGAGDGHNNFNVTINMTTDTGTGAVTSIDSYDSQGRPESATINFRSGNGGTGAGYFL